MIFQDPYSSLNPRHTVGKIVGAPFRLQKVTPEGGVKKAVQEPARAGRAQPGALQPLPARVLRRPAAAHRHRPHAGAQAAADRGRRAGLSPRRVDPGAGGQPPRGPPGGARPDLRDDRPRPLGRPARLGPGRGDVPGQDRRARRPRRPLRAADAPLHGGADVGRADRRTPSGGTSASGSGCRATYPRRSTRRRRAGSTPGAGRRRRSARPRSRRWWSSRPATRWPATSRRTTPPRPPPPRSPPPHPSNWSQSVTWRRGNCRKVTSCGVGGAGTAAK